MTVAEAIAAKIPVLVSNIEGPLEIIDGGRLGLSFENKNTISCAEKIKQFLINGRNDEQVEAAYEYVKINMTFLSLHENIWMYINQLKINVYEESNYIWHL